MPRVKYYDPSGRNAFVERLTASHGEFSSVAEVGRIIGFKNYPRIYEWLRQNNIPMCEVLGRKMYDTAEIAKRLWEVRT